MPKPTTPTTSLPPTSTPAPSGSVTAVAPCCPDVSTFEGSTGVRNTYFGFDDKTNLVANVGVDEYWLPPAKAKAVPSNKETRDGARWVSVGVGLEAQVEIEFGGTFTNACLMNCTYEIDPPAIADVIGPIPIATGAAFKIKGKAAGEASLKVVCGGKVRGYFHIWCANQAVIDIDVGSILTTRTSVVSYSASSLSMVLNEIYGQALIKFNVVDIGTIDLSSDSALASIESRQYVARPSPTFQPSLSFLTALNLKTQAKLIADFVAKGGTYVPSAYQLFYYVPATALSSAGGSVINIGASPGFCFFDNNLPASYNSQSHELGHSLGLEHPVHNAKRDQFAIHALNTLGRPTNALAATNTEPAVASGVSGGNIMASDPLNLMGYWRSKPDRKPIRYHQWKSCSRS